MPHPLRILPFASAALVLALGRLTAAPFQIADEAAFRACVPATSEVTKLAGDFGFIEGPVWVKAGSFLVFSDIPNDELKKWSASGGVITFRKPSHNANGNTFDRNGQLISCEHSGRRVARLDRAGTLQTLVDAFEGKKLNSPNDAVVKSDGSVWFTDPDYGLKTNPQTKKKEGREQPGNYVYRHDPKTGKTTAVVKDCVNPNGLAFSPNEKMLYIADSGNPRHIRKFDVRSDGTLGGGDVFCKIDQGGPDGIRVDREGRMWSSAGDGVHIFSSSGKLIGKILLPEAPANLCFGGDDGKTLFITARKSLYAIKVGVTGAGL